MRNLLSTLAGACSILSLIQGVAIAGEAPKPYTAQTKILVALEGYASCTTDTDTFAGFEKNEMYQGLMKTKAYLTASTGEDFKFFVSCFSKNPDKLYYISSEQKVTGPDMAVPMADSDGVVSALMTMLGNHPNPKAFIIGHSYGGWLSMKAVQTAVSIGMTDVVRVLHTLDPVGKNDCGLGGVISSGMAGSDSPTPDYMLGCRHAPNDLDTGAIAIGTTRWKNVFQNIDVLMHSSEIRAADENLLFTTSDIPMGLDANVTLRESQMIWPLNKKWFLAHLRMSRMDRVFRDFARDVELDLVQFGGVVPPELKPVDACGETTAWGDNVVVGFYNKFGNPGIQTVIDQRSGKMSGGMQLPNRRDFNRSWATEVPVSGSQTAIFAAVYWGPCVDGNLVWTGYFTQDEYSSLAAGQYKTAQPLSRSSHKGMNEVLVTTLPAWIPQSLSADYRIDLKLEHYTSADQPPKCQVIARQLKSSYIGTTFDNDGYITGSIKTIAMVEGATHYQSVEFITLPNGATVRYISLYSSDSCTAKDEVWAGWIAH